MEKRAGKFYYNSISNKGVENFIKISECGTLVILFTRAGGKEFRLEIVPIKKFLVDFFNKEISSEKFTQEIVSILKGFEKQGINIILKTSEL